MTRIGLKWVGIFLLLAGRGEALDRSTVDRSDEVSGKQIHVMYVLSSNGVDRSLDINGTIVATVASFNSWLPTATTARHAQPIRNNRPPRGVMAPSIPTPVSARGLNITVFHIVNSIILRPVPVRDIETLVRFDRMSRKSGGVSITRQVPYPASRFLSANNDVLSAVVIRYSDAVSAVSPLGFSETRS